MLEETDLRLTFFLCSTRSGSPDILKAEDQEDPRYVYRGRRVRMTEPWKMAIFVLRSVVYSSWGRNQKFREEMMEKKVIARWEKMLSCNNDIELPAQEQNARRASVFSFLPRFTSPYHHPTKPSLLMSTTFFAVNCPPGNERDALCTTSKSKIAALGYFVSSTGFGH